MTQGLNTKTSVCVSKMKQNRSRNIGLLLYPEWDNYNDILTKVLPYPHAYIVHDKDLKETEEKKKKKKRHTHAYIQFDNARSFQSIAKWLGIEERFVQGISNRNSYLRYLVHLDNPEKYQYSWDKVTICGLDEEFTKAFSLSAKLSAGYEFKSMYEYITTSTKVLTYQDLSKFAIKEDIITYLRQYYAILKDLLN